MGLFTAPLGWVTRSPQKTGSKASFQIAAKPLKLEVCDQLRANRSPYVFNGMGPFTRPGSQTITVMCFH
jgi:hypothetical protein